MGRGDVKKAAYHYQKCVKILVMAGGLVGAVCLFVVTLITFYEVVARYVFNSPTTWSLDYCIYLVMWATFIGAAYTLMSHGHIKVEVLVEKFSAKSQKYLKIFVYCLALLFCIVLTYTGIVSCLDAYRYKEVTLSYTRTPLYVPMSAIVAGGTLLILEIIRQLIEILQVSGDQK